MAASKGTILITGANGGLGIAIVKQLLSQPEFTVYHRLYAVRDTANASALHGALASHTPHSHDILSVDLTDVDSIRQVAKTVGTRVSSGDIPPIRALILNAGYQNMSGQTWGEYGLDPTFTVNYLGHWLLTMLLLGSMDKESGRIIVVGSQVHECVVSFSHHFNSNSLPVPN
jgi:NAD(P)-dependent dehydrogenase (short-subunit alcohol dehydrogenase family)